MKFLKYLFHTLGVILSLSNIGGLIQGFGSPILWILMIVIFVIGATIKTKEKIKQQKNFKTTNNKKGTTTSVKITNDQIFKIYKENLNENKKIVISNKQETTSNNNFFTIILTICIIIII